MTIRIEVRDVAGVERADLEIEPGKIALIGGLNESGKTSLMEAVTAALTGHALFRIGKKNQGQELVHEGAKRGHVTVANGEGSATITWPGCEVETTGKPPAAASSCYIGMTPWATLDADLRRNMLIHMLDAKPTREHLVTALLGVTGKNFDSLWAKIERDGWDDTHSYLRERIQQAKADWKAVSGEQWGSQKADGWEPKGLDVTRETTSEALQNRIEIAEREHAQAIAGVATSTARLADLRTRIADADAQAARVPELAAQVDAAKAELDGLKKTRDALPDPVRPLPPFPCPHCAGLLVTWVENRQVHVKAAPPNQKKSDAEIAAQHKAKADAENAVRDGEKRLDEAHKAHAAAALGSDHRPGLLAEIESIEAQGAVEIDIDHARKALDDARRTLELFVKREKATEIHARIGRLTTMKDAVATDGVRLTVLREKLGELNDMLARRAAAAHFQAVVIQEDMTVLYGGRPLYLASESGKFRASHIIGTALAKLSGAPIYLVDRVDVLHAHGRGNFLKMLCSLGLPIVAAMTVKAAESLPPIEKTGHGKPYWMEAGVLEYAG